jgi:biotin carboxylase
LTQAAGVLAPQTLHFSVSSLCAGELDAALAAFPFPCVLKPLSGAGSHFVRRVADAATLKAVVAEYRDEAASTGEVAAWGAEPADSAFMAEELLVGKEVDIDLLISHGRIEYLTISDNFPSAGPAELFMEAGGALPSTLPAAAQEGLRAMTHQVVATFGTALHGCYHFEAMWTDRGAFPIELNQRLGGSEVLVLALSVYGVNLGVQALRLALGKPVATVDTAAPRRYCTSTNFLAPDSGYITRVGCSAAVPGDSAYMGSMHRAQPGHPLKAPPLGFEFLGWMVAAGEDFPAAKAALDRLSAEFFCDLREFERGDPHGVVPGTDVYYKDWTGAKPAAEAAVAAGAVCPIGATAAICLAAATIDAGAAVAPAEVDAAPSAAAAQ